MASRHLLGRAIRHTFLRSAARFPPPTGGGDCVAGRILPLGGRSGSSTLLARFGHLPTQAGYYRHLAGGAGTAGYAGRLRGWWHDIGERLIFWSLYVFYMGSLVHILHKEKKWVSKKFELKRVISDDRSTIVILENRLC